MADRQHLSAFLSAKLVGRRWVHRLRASIGLEFAGLPPALIGARVDTQFPTRGLQPRPRLTGLLDQRYRLLAIRAADHASSSVPQIASAFFRSTSNAAASA